MKSPTTRAVVVAALASVGVLGIPATAGATVTSNVNGNTLTVESNADADTITLAVSAGGKLAVNGAEQNLAANDAAEIIVQAGEGNDVVDATALAAANYGQLTVNGGPGDDTLTGGADADSLNGDAGGDRLVGFRGIDTVEGGEGDDVMVWNNGDGTDTNTGDGGTDEVEVNGNPTAGDQFRFKPGAAEGRVQFDRINLVQFGIDLSAERLTLNGLGGNDDITPDEVLSTGLAGRTSLTENGGTGIDLLVGGDGANVLNGGSGVDTVIGGDAADLIRGGDDNDELVGLGGDDRVVGDRGTDLLEGDAGDDVLVWNNGDGSDFDLGGPGFDRAEVNGSVSAGDTLELVRDGSAAKLRRTNLVPFEIALGGFIPNETAPNGSIEAVAVNGGGGPDRLTVGPGLANLPVVANGDAGDDELIGGEENDTFLGGSGADTLTPGAGSDLADGEEGDDRLFTRDGVGDLARGGAGSDSAQTDAVTVDATNGIEALDATPLPVEDPADDTKALLPTLGTIRVVRSKGRLIARVPVSCPEAEAGGCRTTLTLETSRAVRLGRVRAVLVLGSKTVSLDGGQRATASIRMASGAGRAARRGTLRAKVRIASSDAAGNTVVGTKRVQLRLPRGSGVS